MTKWDLSELCSSCVLVVYRGGSNEKPDVHVGDIYKILYEDSICIVCSVKHNNKATLVLAKFVFGWTREISMAYDEFTTNYIKQQI